MSIDERLKHVVGDGDVLSDISPYFREPVTSSKLRVVFPHTAEDVQSILGLAVDLGLPIFTTSDTCFPKPILSEEGILVDFKKMNKIERVDPVNLMVHVQRGVTFEDLGEDLKKYNIKLAPPVAATSHSVVEQYTKKIVSLRGARYPETIVPTNMLVVLSDGRIQRTGSHAISEEAADVQIEMGPFLSYWYFGSDDIFGIVVRASIPVFPMWEERRTLAFAFDNAQEAWGLIRELPRRELCIEATVLDRMGFAGLLGREDGLPSWIAIIGLEGRKKLVDYQERMILERVNKKALDLSGLDGLLDRPWYAIDYPHLGFYTTFNRILEFDKVVDDTIKSEGYSMGDIGRKLISVSYGGGVFCEYDFPTDERAWELAGEVGVRLVERGAFFDRLQGKIAEATYSRMPDNLNLIRKIKKMMDPQNVLNPQELLQEG